MPTAADNGIIHKPSQHSVDETVGKPRDILHAKGVALFALIDHSGEAQKYLKERHGLPEGLMSNIAVVETLAAQIGA